MRLCRYDSEGRALVGFYDESGVIPIVTALEALSIASDADEASDDPVDYLPPDGRFAAKARELAIALGTLDSDARSRLMIPIGRVKLLVPTPRPPKILLLAGNYAAHVIERGGVAVERAETFPYIFMKPPSTTLTHPNDPVRIPATSPDYIDYEAELGVVIGKRCRRVDEAEALGYVAGYTVVNDITDRKYTPNPGRKPRERDKFFDWLHGKWHDTFCPVGPCILSAADLPDPQTSPIRLSVNGQVKQDGSTGQMIFPVAAVIAFLSQLITLEPGDLISTGTPSGVGSSTGIYLKAGDEVVASIGGIGELRNTMTSETA